MDDFHNVKRLIKTRQYDKALLELLGMDLDPMEAPDFAYYLGICYAKMEHWEEALIYLEQVVTSHSSLMAIYQCRLILSYIYNITGRYKLAEYELNKLKEVGFESAQVFSALSYARYEQGDTEGSLECLREALKIDPENANALNSMGYIMAEEDLDYSTALKYCQSAVSQKPENAAYLDSLGWVYYKLGQFGDAKSCLRKALSLAGANDTINRHLQTVLEN